MRKLQFKTNVNAPDSDYPYGRIRNNPGNNTGTPFNELLYGDIHQFFERLFEKSELVANGLPDNSYNGFQLFEALRIAALPYRFYGALISQSTTGAPTSIEMPGNTNKGTMTLSRTGVGDYLITSSVAFPGAVNPIFSGCLGFVKATLISSTEIRVLTYNVAGAAADSILASTGFKLEIHES